MKNAKRFWQTICLLLLICAVVWLCPSKASAKTYTGTCGDGLEWTLDTGTGTLHVSGTGAMQDYSDNSSVPWYLYHASIKTISLSEGVTSIGKYAFYDCAALTTMKLPASVSVIGSLAFGRCTGLTSVVLDEESRLSSIGAYAFMGCTALQSMELPASVADIGGFAFEYCDNLSKLTFSEGSKLTCVEANTFYKCGGLTEIKIPAGVQSVGQNAFYGCEKLRSADIPVTVKEIGKDVFFGCKSLETLSLPFLGATKDGKTNTHFGYLFGAASPSDHAKYIPASLHTVMLLDGATLDQRAFYECKNLRNVYISAAVTDVGASAFEGCSNLMNVVFGEGSRLKTIGKYTFYQCGQLTKIEIPGSVTSIGDNAFEACKSMESVTFGEGSTLASIGSNTFYQCAGLREIILPNTITSIGGGAFAYCAALRSVSFGEDSALVSIGYNAFSGCRSLTQVMVPNGVTSIGKGAFYDCTGLTKMTIPFVGATKNGTVNTHFSYIFGSDSDTYAGLVPVSLKSVEVTGGTSIDARAFYKCLHLTEVVIAPSVMSIGKEAFFGCDGLTTLTIPFVGAAKNGTENMHFGYIFGATTYAYHAQYVPKSLKKVVVSGGTLLGAHAFDGCGDLADMILPGSLVSIGDGAFAECKSLTSISFDGTAQAWETLKIGAENDILSCLPVTFLKKAEPVETTAWLETSTATETTALETSPVETMEETTRTPETTNLVLPEDNGSSHVLSLVLAALGGMIVGAAAVVVIGGVAGAGVAIKKKKVK